MLSEAATEDKAKVLAVDYKSRDDRSTTNSSASACSTGRGIQNTSGSDCYIISAIQTLFTLRTEFVNPLHDFFVRHRDELGQQSLAYQLLALAAACFSSETVNLPTTMSLMEVLKAMMPGEFENGGQQDCALLTTHLLSALSRELEAVAGADEMLPTDVFKFRQVNTFHCEGCNESR